MIGEFFGFIFLLVAVVAIALLALLVFMKYVRPAAASPTGSFGASTSVEPDKTAEDVVNQAKLGGFISVNGQNEQVKGIACGLELRYFDGGDGDWRHTDPDTGRKLREFKLVFLAGKQLLFEHLKREGGGLGWHLYADRTDDIPGGFNEYLHGTDANPGPARKFADSEQQGDVEIQALGKTWKARDIMWLDIDVKSGRMFVHKNDDGLPRIAALLAQNGDEVLLYMNLRSGDGSDTLWVGREIDLDIEVDVI